MISLTCHNGIFSLSLVSQFALFMQLKQEAGIRGSVNLSNYDALLAAAGKRGLGLETVERT